jgi:hypothetical protein
MFRNFIDCRHYGARRRLMHHMAGAWDGMESTLDNIVMKSTRLFFDVDLAIFLARDDADGHLQRSIFVLEVNGVRIH